MLRAANQRHAPSFPRSPGGSRWPRTIRIRQDAKRHDGRTTIAVVRDQVIDRVADHPWDEVEDPCPLPARSSHTMRSVASGKQIEECVELAHEVDDKAGQACLAFGRDPAHGLGQLKQLNENARDFDAVIFARFADVARSRARLPARPDTVTMVRSILRTDYRLRRS